MDASSAGALEIDRAGVIQSSDVDPDCTRRIEPSATIAVLQSLAR